MDSDRDQIDMGRKDIKALSSDTRVEVLKVLSKSRKIAADLAKILDVTPSTMAEHLEKLEEAGLVQRIEDGHKWIYYEITRKGRNVIEPRIPIRLIITVFVGLAVAVSLIAGGFFWAGRSASLQESAGQQLDKSSASLSQQLQIESASGNTLIIRNLGSVPIDFDSVAVFINGTLTECSAWVSGNGGIGMATCILEQECAEGDQIRVTSASGETSGACS